MSTPKEHAEAGEKLKGNNGDSGVPKAHTESTQNAWGAPGAKTPIGQVIHIGKEYIVPSNLYPGGKSLAGDLPIHMPSKEKEKDKDTSKEASKPAEAATDADILKMLNIRLTPAAELNVPYTELVNPCATHMPCLTVHMVPNEKALTQIPERKGNDAIVVEDYGIQKDGRLEDKQIWFTPADGKLYINHGGQITELEPKVPTWDRSGGATLQYEDGTVIKKHPDFGPRSQAGYTIETASGYELILYTDKNKAPESSYHGVDLDQFKKHVNISPLSGKQMD